MSRHIVLEASFPRNSRTEVKLADWSHQSLTAGCLSDCSHIQIAKVTTFEMGGIKQRKNCFLFHTGGAGAEDGGRGQDGLHMWQHMFWNNGH